MLRAYAHPCPTSMAASVPRPASCPTRHTRVSPREDNAVSPKLSRSDFVQWGKVGKLCDKAQQEASAMETALRKTGIAAVGDIPWGTHLCHFYEARRDLLDIVVPYFKAGLEHHEFCLWVLAESLTEHDARSALRRAVPDLDRYLAERRIAMLPHDACYSTSGAFDLHRVMHGWYEQLALALAEGYAGMRATGDAAGLDRQDWKDFSAYEHALNASMNTHRMIMLC